MTAIDTPSPILSYSYIRFSTKAQRKGSSYDRQLSKAITYCAAHNLVLDTKLRMFDEGVSAFKGNNQKFGALSRFIEYIALGRIKPGSILIVESLDRLSRQDLDEAMALFRRILKADVNIITLTNERMYTKKSLDTTYELIEAILNMSRANEESVRKSGHLLDSWERKRLKLRNEKTFFTKAMPRWLSRDKKNEKFVPIPDRVAIVERIFDMAKNGYGKYRIMAALNLEKIPAFKKPSWSTSSIRKLLSNRSLIGEYQPHKMINGKRVPEGDPICDYFPEVISRVLFDSIQIKFENSPPVKGSQQTISNLFTGIIKCSICH